MVVESNPANISCFPRRLQCNTFHLPRRLQDVFAIRFPKTSSRCLQDVFKTCLQDVLQLCLQTSSRRLGRQKNVTLTTSSRCLQDVFSTSSPRRMFAGRFSGVNQWNEVGREVSRRFSCVTPGIRELSISLFLFKV